MRDGAELLNRVRRQAPPLAMALGSTGSGKSLLIRAGIVPQRPRDAERRLVVEPLPGPAPRPIRVPSVTSLACLP